MPKPKHSTHPDHTRTSASKPVPADSTIDAPKAHHASPYQTPMNEPTNAYNALRDLLRRDDGWLRVAPDIDGKVVWWKWKITRGKWAGHYVMVRGFVDQQDEAMDVLNRKLANVDLGYDRPTRDSYYDQG